MFPPCQRLPKSTIVEPRPLYFLDLGIHKLPSATTSRKADAVSPRVELSEFASFSISCPPPLTSPRGRGYFLQSPVFFPFVDCMIFSNVSLRWRHAAKPCDGFPFQPLHFCRTLLCDTFICFLAFPSTVSRYFLNPLTTPSRHDPHHRWQTTLSPPCLFFDS